jgi:hypothetical protein
MRAASMKAFARETVATAVSAEMLAETEIEFPDLTAFPEPREKALRLLQVAASIEHALMVQYLYAGAAYSGDKPTLAECYHKVIGVAIEEMSHLMTVQNLLKIIGAEPDLSRQDFGPALSDEHRLFPFDLALEPISHQSLAKYIVAESPTDIPHELDPALMVRIVAAATQGTGAPVNRVGTLYALLGAVFASETLLRERAATADPWYLMVNDLATEAAAVYGGRDRLHLPNAAFQPDSVRTQCSDDDWDRSLSKSFDEFRVHVVDGREAAVGAIRDIGLQGEGPSAVASEESHFMRFVKLFKTFYGDDGTGTGPAASAAAVPSAAVIAVDETSTHPEAISHPDTVRWAHIANHRYAIMLGSLELHLRQPADDRYFLVGWCFAEMFAIKFLSSVLTRKPRTTHADSKVGAVPFTLPGWTGRAVEWTDIEAELIDAEKQQAALLAENSLPENQRRVLMHLAASDARKLAEARKRQSGDTARRKPDRAREILDRAAGTADPPHTGNSPSFPTQDQGRFWNLSINEFKQTSVLGANIVKPAFPGADAPLVSKLRTGDMPRGRAPLSPTGADFRFIEQWVKDGCPDDPV